MRTFSLNTLILATLFLLGQMILPPSGLTAAQVEPENELPLLDVLKNFPASIRTENLQVSTLLRGIGRQAGINILVAENITETINFDVENLNLYEAFMAILDAKQLRCYQKNNVIIVEKKAAQGETRDFVSERFCTKFGNATAYVDQLKPLLGQNGSITVTNRGNCLVIQDRAGNIPRLRDLLGELDQPIPQVHIEARIVSISNAAKKQLGIIWGDVKYTRDNLPDKTTSLGAGINLPAKDPSTTLAFGFIRENFNLNVELQAMQSDNLLEILSSPSVLVLDGMPAEIKQGKEVPYVTGGTSLTPSNTSFREANLGLKVKPTVLRDGYIILDVNVTNDSVDEQSSQNSSGMLINKQAINTNLFLEDNVTVVIGGIVQKNKQYSNGKVPGLGDIPLLGNLFKNTSKSDEQTELMVFITPRIVNMVAPKRTNEAAGVTGREKITPPATLSQKKPDTQAGSQP
ncbi:MAG: hypothetical protein WC001_01780 [Desulfurivibrionaceae bacterium]